MEKSMGQEYRLLDLYTRLQKGQAIRKDEEADRFQVNKRTIQRDIDHLRAFLAEQNAQGTEHRELIYDRKKEAYVLLAANEGAMSSGEILAVTKILLESRAFTSEEMEGILKKLLCGCVPSQNRAMVEALIANEVLHYVPPRHRKRLVHRLWELGEAVRHEALVKLDYRRMDGTVTEGRVVEPVAVLFSEYYFYLIAYQMSADSSGSLSPAHDYPSYYRVDRIQSYTVQKEHFSIPYARRFEGGELRKRVQFMYGGSLRWVRFLYRGPSIEAVYDRLPTAKASQTEDGSWLVTAEVFGEGIIQWLLSQGPAVEVLSPPELRREIAIKLRRMLRPYRDEE